VTKDKMVLPAGWMAEKAGQKEKDMMSKQMV
jgi:hypothetical protein